MGNFAEWEEITPLGEGSKISEEDPPLCIGDSKIKISVSEETLRLERKLKFSYNSNLNTKVCHKGLYTMGQNTKRPNTTKGLIKPKKKHYKNYKRVLVLQSEANSRSLLRSWT